MGDTPHDTKKEAFAVSVPEVVARTEEKAKD
jgi:hypothetical protein